MGFSGLSLQVWHDPNRPPGWTYLVEVLGFISPNNDQLSHLKEELSARIARIIPLGGYSTPLDEGDLAEVSNSEEAKKNK